ncbi:MAG: hypothetical protein IJU68_00220 [Bacteroidales bacterium]|nr:hypothetical protein [Bacteroidales bacterium]
MRDGLKDNIPESSIHFGDHVTEAERFGKSNTFLRPPGKITVFREYDAVTPIVIDLIGERKSMPLAPQDCRPPMFAKLLTATPSSDTVTKNLLNHCKDFLSGIIKRRRAVPTIELSAIADGTSLRRMTGSKRNC